MPNYIRYHENNACYFFTVNLWQRHNNTLLVDEIDALKRSILHVKRRYPFHIHAWVVLPDHLHCIWQLPQGDVDYSKRWRLIKSHFSKQLQNLEDEPTSASRFKRGERGIWQRRFWEHTIRNQADFDRHVDYIHINPLKHGYVQQVKDWPYSTFHYFVKESIYSQNWKGEMLKPR